jgi:hypothetical protein
MARSLGGEKGRGDGAISDVLPVVRSWVAGNAAGGSFHGVVFAAVLSARCRSFVRAPSVLPTIPPAKAGNRDECSPMGAIAMSTGSGSASKWPLVRARSARPATPFPLTTSGPAGAGVRAIRGDRDPRILDNIVVLTSYTVILPNGRQAGIAHFFGNP